MKVAPLRQLYSKYLHQKIPPEDWTEDLKHLFPPLKQDLISEPVLARYDSSIPVFLKTNWSSLGVSFILMQPSDDKVANAALKNCWTMGYVILIRAPTVHGYAQYHLVCANVPKVNLITIALLVRLPLYDGLFQKINYIYGESLFMFYVT